MPEQTSQVRRTGNLASKVVVAAAAEVAEVAAAAEVALLENTGLASPCLTVQLAKIAEEPLEQMAVAVAVVGESPVGTKTKKHLTILLIVTTIKDIV